jgi:dihydrofolate reductase
MSPASQTTVDITMSLDGFVAGPDPTIEGPLGAGGERLHEWVYDLDSWRQRHGLSGGERNADAEVVDEGLAATGAVIMGRRMFSGGAGPWEDDPVADGWWGDDPPFHVPVFVLTHHARAPLEMEGGTVFHFVTGGIEAALDQARRAARDKDVRIGGGAATIRQYLQARLIDEMHLAISPVLLGNGEPLFEGIDLPALGYRVKEYASTEAAIHLMVER